MAKSYEEISNTISAIKNETATNSITPTRIGSCLQDILDYAQSLNTQKVMQTINLNNSFIVIVVDDKAIKNPDYSTPKTGVMNIPLNKKERLYTFSTKEDLNAFLKKKKLLNAKNDE